MRVRIPPFREESSDYTAAQAWRGTPSRVTYPARDWLRSSTTLKERTIVRTSTLVALVLVAGACTVEKNAGSTDTGAAKAPPPAPDSTSTPAPPATTPWTVVPSGIGAITVGMTVDDLKRVGGDFATKPNTSTAECTYVHPTNVPAGVMVMLAKGTVARVDVDSAGVISDAGIAVGDSASRVAAAYSSAVTTTPHKYVQGGQYLTVRPTAGDANLRMVFESEGGRITRFRSGRVPEVEFVERCG